jgi:hypothetical protein
MVVSGADAGKCLDCRTDALLATTVVLKAAPAVPPDAASATAPMNLGIDVRLYGYGTAWPRGGVT